MYINIFNEFGLLMTIHTEDTQYFRLYMELVLRGKCWDKTAYVFGTDDCDYINSLPYLFVLYFRVGIPDPPPPKKPIFC